ncbi:FadR/GntR family transcriptional regulator [Maridesulfovibrio zosterae]|uniref:FadR/GntR family transcriptional regulator n=1 Tax=Maridesulfovibrio zosterae TaxID=82171 RepID=UPI000488AECF|nr:FadR/GntR family transcriptional regulator [Maridesulfovibrio zosterae]
MFKPIKKVRVSETAAKQLEELIQNKTFTEGEPLPSERHLMKELQVGRGSIREALRILEIKGFIETQPGIGAFVKSYEGDIFSPLSTWLKDNNEALSHFFEVRALLEPSTARMAAERISAEDFEALQRNTDEFAARIEEDDLPRAILVDAEFHRLLGKATGNKVLSSIMEALYKTMIEGWKAPLKIPGQPRKSLREHIEILAAIKDKDGEKAANLMNAHLQEALEGLGNAGLKGSKHVDD